jgi:hypothetical protein
MYLVQLARMIMKDAEKHLVVYSKLCFEYCTYFDEYCGLCEQL